MEFMEYLRIKNLLCFHVDFYELVAMSCSKFNTVCRMIMGFFVEDHPTDRIDYEQFFKNFMFTPAGTSARNVNHWIQFYNTKLFQQFDYGKEINLLKYG